MQRIYHQYIDLPSWNLTRLVSVVFGISLLIMGLLNHDDLTTILASLVLLQGFLRVGCMGGACAAPSYPPADPISSDTESSSHGS